MEVPKIVIDGKEYTPSKPKAGVWRELMEFEETKKDIQIKDWLDKHADIIAKVFAQDGVTGPAIIANSNVDEVVPLYNKCFDWLVAITSGKLAEIPNADTAAASK